MDENPWGAPATPSPQPSPNLDGAPKASVDSDVAGGIDFKGADGVEELRDEHDADASESAVETDEADTASMIKTADTPPEAPVEEAMSPKAAATVDSSSLVKDDQHDGDNDDNDDGFSEPPASTPSISRSLSMSLPPMDEGPPMDDFDDDESGPTPTAPETDPEPGASDEFDDFDDFGEANVPAADDDFGDFGDFDEQTGADAFGDGGAFDEPAPVSTTSQVIQEQQPVRAASFASFQSTGHPPLVLDLSDKSKSAIAPQLHEFLEGVYPGADAMVSDEPERQVEGVGQVLASESTRALLANLSSLPPLRPLDWRRSRVRREHLIVLGVPINLDDTAPAKALTSLVLPSQRSSSPFSPGVRTQSPTRMSSPTPGPPSRSSTPFADRERARSARSLPPPLDRKFAESLLALTEDDFVGMSLTELRKKMNEMDRISEEASTTLTHALVMREKESGDAETYNGMIQDLVAAAAKTKTTSAGGRSSPALRSSSGRWGRSAVK